VTERACTTCELCLREDSGYSNYTVIETNLYCLAGLNPALEGSEEPSREPTPELAAALDVALACPKYREGTPAWLDVDHEGIPYRTTLTSEIVKQGGYTDDDEAAELLVARLSN
jgi:hypothetical protein